MDALTEHQKIENQEYRLTHVQKEEIIARLRDAGCRITKQRRLLIDVILDSECNCCKEIYYTAVKKMPEIGMATIYRMINSLEEVGAIQRRNSYRICMAKECEIEGCVIELENEHKIELDQEAFWRILEAGMKACAYTDLAKIKKTTAIHGQGEIPLIPEGCLHKCGCQ